MSGITLGRWCATTSLVALSLLPAGKALAAPGPDETTVDRYIELVGWLTDVHYSPAQKAELRATVQGYWRNNDQQRMDNVSRSLQLWQQLHEASQDLREATLAMTRPDVLVSLQQDARKGGSDSQWLFNAFLKAHPPLAPGKEGSVPLTRDMVDAALEMEYFMQAEVLNRPMRVVDRRAREKAYRESARSYGSLTVEQQLDIAKKPGQLALERGRWARMGPQLRALVRAQMGGNLSPEDQYLVQEFQSMGSRHMQSMLSSELANMQQNSNIIMGSGTTWNSTLGRWEQHGGIVTEFDSGVVRVP